MTGCVSLNQLRKATFWLIFASVCSLVFWVYFSNEEVQSSRIPHRKFSPEFSPLKEKISSSREHKVNLPKPTKNKIILMWFVPFHDYAMVQENLFIGSIQEKSHRISWNTSQCGTCTITYNRKLLNSSDAVIFHKYYPNEGKKFPYKTNKQQVFVWWTQESNSNAPYYSYMDQYFDWTMTSSRRADVYSPYATFAWMLKALKNKLNGVDFMEKMREIKGEIPAEQEEVDYLMSRYFIDDERQNKPTKTDDSFQRLLNNKRKLVAWVASNCHTEGAKSRLYVVESLEDTGLSIDKFGSCNFNNLPFSNWDPEFYNFLSRYKFYLSFENSVHCRDYITEKLWYNALYSGAVPVIWGPHRDDVRAVLPPKSYIHVEDFNSMREVVKYLKYLDSNSTAYAEYLEWRTWIKFLDENGEYHPENQRLLKETERPTEKLKLVLKKYLSPKQIGFCRLCRMLHAMEESGQTKRTGTPFSETERSECLDYQEGYDIMKKLLGSRF